MMYLLLKNNKISRYVLCMYVCIYVSEKEKMRELPSLSEEIHFHFIKMKYDISASGFSIEQKRYYFIIYGIKLFLDII